MSTPEPLPPLTEADVPAWVRLRRDAAGEPYLVVAWWPRLACLKLSTRSRPISGRNDLELATARFVLVLALNSLVWDLGHGATFPFGLLPILSTAITMFWLLGEPAALYLARDRIVAARGAQRA